MATAKEFEQTKQLVKDAMVEFNVSASTLIRLGDMAEAVLKDKSLYPKFLQATVDSNLAEKEDIDISKIDYQFIGAVVSLGKMAEQMVSNNEIEA